MIKGPPGARHFHPVLTMNRRIIFLSVLAIVATIADSSGAKAGEWYKWVSVLHTCSFMIESPEEVYNFFLSHGATNDSMSITYDDLGSQFPDQVMLCIRKSDCALYFNSKANCEAAMQAH